MEKKEQIVKAVTSAVLFKPELMTGDSINALEGGHGMLNVAAFCAANAIAEEILRGCSLKIRALNQVAIDMDKILEAGVKTAMAFGADQSNAALITAILCYLAGSNVRAGVPSGNRKLGAMARIKAGAQRGGVQSIPTPKANNKISGFPAVYKIYEAMLEGKLTRVSGEILPAGIGGGLLVGHSTLGEDYIFPEVAENAAAIGGKAMMRAYVGAGMKGNPFISAVFGAAAALEIVHSDALMPEKFCTSSNVYTPKVAGIGAVKATGLPETIHFRVTGEEFDTATLIGDLGLILKDMGTPTVVGMLTFYELLGCFVESPKIGAGGSGGPRTAPIGHVAADASMVLRTIALTGSMEEAAKIVAKNKESFVDPVYAAIEANTVARKVENLREGMVSRAVLLATDCATHEAIRTRVEETINQISHGETLTDVIISLEKKRIQVVEKRTSAMMSKSLGKNINIKVTKLSGNARRSARMSKLLYVLDPDIDVALIIDGEEIVMKNLAHEIIPNAVLTKDKKILELLPLIAPAVGELLVSGHTLIDLLVPTATATLLGKGSPEKMAKEAASRGSLATGGLPGSVDRALEVATLALECYHSESQPSP